jgi:hypothetical protein
MVATARLARVEQRLAALPSTSLRPRMKVSVQASLIALSEALTRHAAYFDAGAAR